MALGLHVVSGGWESDSPSTDTVNISNVGQFGIVHLITGDGSGAASTLDPFTVATFDGNAYTRQTACDNTTSGRILSAFTRVQSIGSTGNKTGALTWTGDAFTRRGFLAAFRSSIGGVVSVVTAGIEVETSSWDGTVSQTGTISGFAANDLIVFIWNINGDASNITDDNGDMTIHAEGQGTSTSTYGIGSFLAVDTTYDYSFTHAGGTQGATVSYIVFRETGSASNPKGVFGLPLRGPFGGPI